MCFGFNCLYAAIRFQSHLYWRTYIYINHFVVHIYLWSISICVFICICLLGIHVWSSSWGLPLGPPLTLKWSPNGRRDPLCSTLIILLQEAPYTNTKHTYATHIHKHTNTQSHKYKRSQNGRLDLGLDKFESFYIKSHLIELQNTKVHHTAD